MLADSNRAVSPAVTACRISARASSSSAVRGRSPCPGASMATTVKPQVVTVCVGAGPQSRRLLVQAAAVPHQHDGGVIGAGYG